MPQFSKPQRRYVGGLTNTDRWADFEGRSGDVFVSTPPKCGTTWTTTIVTMLCHGTTDVTPTKSVQWMDAEVVPLDEALRAVEAQTERRCIKSHTPFDGIPVSDAATYVAVYRHPLDMYFSFRKHTANTKEVEPDHPFLKDPDTGLRYFVETPVDFEDYEDNLLEAVVTHFRSYKKRAYQLNVLLIHYADLTADAPAVIRQLAAVMGVEVTARHVEAICEATRFNKMKADPVRFAPFADRGFWNNPAAFFESGSSQKWTGRLSEAALDLYQSRIAALLDKEERQWLENGSRL